MIEDHWTPYAPPEEARPRPPLPSPRLPNPGRTENGMAPCNTPLVVDGVTVGYCDRLVKVGRHGTRKPHRQRHRIEWS